LESAVTLIVVALHATKVIAGFEDCCCATRHDYAGATRIVGKKWQYVLVLLIALGVAWLTLSNVPRMARLVVNRVVGGGTVWPRVGLLSLRAYFSAGAVILALVFAVLAAEGWSAFYAGTAHI